MLVEGSKSQVKDNYLIFTIGKYRFGINIMAVSEIRDSESINEVHGGSTNLLGMVNIRNSEIPVYSLSNKFNVSKAENDNISKWIVSLSNNKLIAFEVGDIIGVDEFSKEDIYPVPNVLKLESTKYMRQISNKNNETTILLDEDHLIDEEEFKEIENIILGV